MTTNGGNGGRSLVKETLNQISDHIELAALEWRYEKDQSLRTVAAIGAAVFLLFFAFALIQIALIRALMVAGLSLGLACMVLAAVYATSAVVIVMKFGKRDRRAGEPFAGTRREARETFQWIQKLF